MEAASKAQQRGMGISSIKVSTAVGAKLTAMDAVCFARSGMVMRGCVFFISTTGAGRVGGSGNKEMRAVSFLGPADEAVPEPTGATGAGLGIKGATPAGAAELAEGGGTGALRKTGGGATARAGGGGSGVCA